MKLQSGRKLIFGNDHEEDLDKMLVNIENLSPVKNNNKNDDSESDNLNDLKGFSQVEV